MRSWTGLCARKQLRRTDNLDGEVALAEAFERPTTRARVQHGAQSSPMRRSGHTCAFAYPNRRRRGWQTSGQRRACDVQAGVEVSGYGQEKCSQGRGQRLRVYRCGLLGVRVACFLSLHEPSDLRSLAWPMKAVRHAAAILKITCAGDGA
jgi:hypothetical protein